MVVHDVFRGENVGQQGVGKGFLIIDPDQEEIVVKSIDSRFEKSIRIVQKVLKLLLGLDRKCFYNRYVIFVFL